VWRSNIVSAQVRTVVSLGTAITPGLITSRTETVDRPMTVGCGSTTWRV
jgi:hypothetical protein